MNHDAPPGVNYLQMTRANIARGPDANEGVDPLDSESLARQDSLTTCAQVPCPAEFPLAFADNCYLGRPGAAGDGPDPPGIAPGDGPRIGGPIAGPLD